MPPICQFYKKGNCRFGTRCWNSHDSSSSSVSNKERKENPVQTVNTISNKSQRRNQGYDMTRNSSLKIKSETLTVTNLSSEEKISDEQYVISELFKKLSLAEKEISTLNKKLEDKKCKRDIFSCTEHNYFQLNDAYLHCAICYELFIKPTVLNCSHMFCQWCIESWSSVNSECPICRKNVVNKSYCLDLDYYIKNIIELGPIEMKNSYKLLAEKRNLEGPNDIQPDTDDEDNWTMNNQVNPFHGYLSI